MAIRRSARLNNSSNNATFDAEASNGLPTSDKKRKATVVSKTEIVDKDGFTVSSSPKKKKTTKAVLPSTPTPDSVKMMGLPYSSGDIDGSMPPTSRIADPHMTNAPLVSPETSRVFANKSIDSVSPSKKSQSTTTTSNILEKACDHLIKTEPRLEAVIKKHPCSIFSPEGLAEEIDPFRSLASGIISQQVGVTAAIQTHL